MTRASSTADVALDLRRHQYCFRLPSACKGRLLPRHSWRKQHSPLPSRVLSSMCSPPGPLVAAAPFLEERLHLSLPSEVLTSVCSPLVETGGGCCATCGKAAFLSFLGGAVQFVISVQTGGCRCICGRNSISFSLGCCPGSWLCSLPILVVAAMPFIEEPHSIFHHSI